MQNRRRVVAGKLPRGDVREPVVVAQRLAIPRLVLDAEVRPARLLTMQRIDAHQLRELQEIGDASGALQLLIELLARARHEQILPELLAQRRNELQCRAQPLGAARQAAVLPNDLPKLAMERRRRPRATNRR